MGSRTGLILCGSREVGSKPRSWIGRWSVRMVFFALLTASGMAAEEPLPAEGLRELEAGIEKYEAGADSVALVHLTRAVELLGGEDSAELAQAYFFRAQCLWLTFQQNKWEFAESAGRAAEVLPGRYGQCSKYDHSNEFCRDYMAGIERFQRAKKYGDQARAQSSSPTSSVDPIPPSAWRKPRPDLDRLSLRFIGGLNIATMDSVVEGMTHALLPAVGAGMSIALFWRLDVQFDALFIQKGAKFTGGSPGSGYEVVTKLNYLEGIPALSIGTQDGTFFVSAGLGLGFLLSAKSVVKYAEGGTVEEHDVSSQVEDEDRGWVISMGVFPERSHTLLLEARYAQGIRDVFRSSDEQDNPRSRNRGIYLLVGFCL